MKYLALFIIACLGFGILLAGACLLGHLLRDAARRHIESRPVDMEHLTAEQARERGML